MLDLCLKPYCSHQKLYRRYWLCFRNQTLERLYHYRYCLKLCCYNQMHMQLLLRCYRIHKRNRFQQRSYLHQMRNRRFLMCLLDRRAYHLDTVCFLYHRCNHFRLLQYYCFHYPRYLLVCCIC